MDLGAGRRGTDMGPSALRLAKLGPALTALGHTVTDLGNIDVPLAEAGAGQEHGSDRARFAAEITRACTLAFERLSNLPAGTLPLTLGGDHSVGMATVSA